MAGTRVLPQNFLCELLEPLLIETRGKLDKTGRQDGQSAGLKENPAWT